MCYFVNMLHGRWWGRRCHTASPTEMSDDNDSSAWRPLRNMRKQHSLLWEQQSNKPGLAATPSIQRCGSAGGRQGAAASPAKNGSKKGTVALGKGLNSKTHRGRHTQTGFIQSHMLFKTLRLVVKKGQWVKQWNRRLWFLLVAIIRSGSVLGKC